jgi:hypothetical protein
MPSPALDSCSKTTTEYPCSLQNFAIDKPTTPAPIMVTSKNISKSLDQRNQRYVAGRYKK